MILNVNASATSVTSNRFVQGSSHSSTLVVNTRRRKGSRSQPLRVPREWAGLQGHETRVVVNTEKKPCWKCPDEKIPRVDLKTTQGQIEICRNHERYMTEYNKKRENVKKNFVQLNMSSMIYTLYGFAVFFMIFWLGMWIVHILALATGRWKLHRKQVQVPSYEVPFPGVSVIKPLMGVDPNLFNNLETFFTMDYPLYELLFCVEDESDQALMLVKKLIEKYPQVDTRLFIGGCSVGVNPKINNMQPAYEASKHELILISDSGIRVKEDTLLDMVQYMTDNVALVHQLPFTCDREGFAAAYEKIYFGTVQSRMYLAADVLRINCHTGMSALLRKAPLNEVGGLKTFGVYLAEDFFYAKSLVDRGWRITVCSQPALQNSGHCDMHSFQARLRRWAKLRVAMLPSTIILEPLSECLILGACASWASAVLFEWDSLVFYLVHILLWFMLDWAMLCVVHNSPLPLNKLEFVCGWLLSEITRPYLFLQAVLDPLIQWRSRVYKLKWGGIAEEVKAKVKY